MNITRVNSIQFKGFFDRFNNRKGKIMPYAIASTNNRLNDEVRITKKKKKETAPIELDETQIKNALPIYIKIINEGIRESDRLYEKGAKLHFDWYDDEKTGTNIFFQENPWNPPYPMWMEQLRKGERLMKVDYSDYKNFEKQGAYSIELKDEKGVPFVADIAYGEPDRIIPNYTLLDRAKKIQPEYEYIIDTEDNIFAYPIDVVSRGKRIMQFYCDVLAIK